MKIPKLACKRCGHDWVPRQADVRMCPRCKSVRWDQELDSTKAERKRIVPATPTEPDETD